MARAETIGLASMFSFAVSNFGRGVTAAERLRGCLRLKVGGKDVWSSTLDQGGVEWSWDELLENLAVRWVDLFTEETYPGGLTPLIPSQIWQEVRKRIGPQEDNEATPSLQEAVFTFDGSHNLALMISGIDLPSVRFMKLGRLMIVDASRPEYGEFNHFTAALLDVKEILKQLCAEMLAFIEDLEDERSAYLRKLWQTRERSGKIPLSLIYGTDNVQAEKLEGVVQSTLAKSKGSSLEELRVAARMLSGAVKDDVLGEMLNLLTTITFEAASDSIDDISENAQAALRSKATKRPHEQGYYLARWLRKTGGIKDDEKISQIENSLERYGIKVKQSDFGPNSNSVDALAIWRPKMAPIIWMNIRGDHVVDNPARRATLAHELCHILLDRSGALPFLEVLGGAVAQLPERRANAFAAEFLCPQSFITRECGRTSDPDELVAELTKRFEVGRQLAANQTKNWYSKLIEHSPLRQNLGPYFLTRVERLSRGSY